MKRVLCLLLLLLSLTGCGGEVQETQAPTESTLAPATEPSGSYDPDSTLEMFTGGAIRAYPLEIPDVYAIAAAGSDVLVFSGWGNTTVTRLAGENLFRIAEITLDVELHPGSPNLLITEDRMVYYDDNTREMVWLDESFREFSRLQLPEDMVDAPVISANRLYVYYCTEEGVRALDVESGISRLLKQVSYPVQYVDGLLMHDTVLKFCVSDGETEYGTMFLDVQTGELLEQISQEITLFSGSGMYCGYHTRGDTRSLIFGISGGHVRELFPADPDSTTTFLPDTGGAVSYGTREERWYLDYYDLASGQRKSSIALPEAVVPWQYAADGVNGRVYFLCYGEAESQILCRWDLSKSLTGEQTLYTDAWYTREAPDQEGLAACQARADALSQRYGLDIRIWEDAVKDQPYDYTLDPAWQVPVIEQGLDTLEGLLASFPEDFFTQTMENLEDGRLRLCLVEGLTGSYESGSLETADGIQFWIGNDAYIALALGQTLEKTFFHELFHVMETRILSRSITLYRWDELNPKGFEYDFDYIENQYRDGSYYLDDDTTRSFIDAYSMSFPKEDRARIFEYACREGNESCFISATMQKKLRTICEGIREAYGLEKSPEVFLWEQYLESPLAYEGK